MLLDEDYRDLFKFLTQWGCYWFLVNPQYQHISGDAYMYQYNKILESLERWVGYINDCALWEVIFEDHFYQVMEFLKLTSSRVKFWETQVEVHWVKYQ